ncbi:alpha/beta hydrolase [Candidatus Marinamargulisbacteria bacterium SCGC AG-410-N11]|nr:alpha/beta hydrolase [Candidatus Marinamargulisbacteria bacterium SCGC AG-410-N11]
MDLNCEKYGGEGENVIILHGLLGSAQNWRTHAKKLAVNNKVYVLDLPNHGKSPHFLQHDYPFLANQVGTYLKQHNIKPATIIGHSMGGKVAMQLVHDYPGLIKKLMVVDIAPKTYIDPDNLILRTLNAVNLNRLQSREEIDKKMAETITEKQVRAFLLTNLARDQQSKFYWKSNVSLLCENYNEILKSPKLINKIPIKTMFIKGTNSNYINTQDLLTIKKWFDDVSIKSLNTGHWVHAEQPTAFLDVANQFLSG